ncbi:MAG: hypothetical protein WDN46_06865 [Methylocella sp.]
MRYYDINVGGGPHYTSLVNGKFDPGALNVEMDIQVQASDVPAAGSYVRIWGIGLAAISQSQSLFGKPITVRGGMSAGLPLAKPQQQGVLVTGSVWQCFANWIGTDQTQDFVITTPFNAPTSIGPNPKTPPKNIVLNWKKGTPLSQPLQNALRTAYPGTQVNVQISPMLVYAQDEVGYHGNLEQFGTYLRRISQEILGPSYSGVSLNFNTAGGIDAVDGTTPVTAPVIAYEDLIGQPTWIEAFKIQFKTVMRGDIKFNSVITLPKTLITNVQGNNSQAVNQGLTFQGGFTVSSIRHCGNFRQPDAASWVSIFEAYANNPQGSAQFAAMAANQ